MGRRPIEQVPEGTVASAGGGVGGSSPPSKRPSPADAFAPPEEKLRLYRLAFDRIVDRVYDVPDPEAEYDALEKAISLGAERANRGRLQECLDEACACVLRAHKLSLAAEEVYETFRAENEVAYAAKRTEANAALQKEKDQGLRSKMITDADIEGKVAAMFPDDFVASKRREKRMHGMRDQVRKLVSAWESRVSTIQTQINGLR